jgi:hypothetical protein
MNKFVSQSSLSSFPLVLSQYIQLPSHKGLFFYLGKKVPSHFVICSDCNFANQDLLRLKQESETNTIPGVMADLKAAELFSNSAA